MRACVPYVIVLYLTLKYFRHAFAGCVWQYSCLPRVTTEGSEWAHVSSHVARHIHRTLPPPSNDYRSSNTCQRVSMYGLSDRARTTNNEQVTLIRMDATYEYTYSSTSVLGLAEERVSFRSNVIVATLRSRQARRYTPC